MSSINKFLYIILFSSFLIYGRDIEPICWPMSYTDYLIDGYLYLSGPFGPREYKRWFHSGVDLAVGTTEQVYNPLFYDDDEWLEVKEVIGDQGTDNRVLCKVGSGCHPDIVWMVFWHVQPAGIMKDDVYPGRTDMEMRPYNESPIHLHFDVFIIDVGDPDDPDTRKMHAKSPMQWLLHPSRAFVKGGWFTTAYDSPLKVSKNNVPLPNFNPPNPNREFDVNFTTDPTQNNRHTMKVTTREHKHAINTTGIGVFILDQPNYLWEGSTILDADTRTGPIFAEMTSPTYPSTEMDNVYYKGNKVNPYPFDYTLTDPRKIEWYFYPKFNFQPGDIFNIRFQTPLEFITISNLTYSTGIGINPPDEAPAPPQYIAAETVQEGIRVSWDRSVDDIVDVEVAYLIYRRRADSPDIYDAFPIYLTRSTSFVDKLHVRNDVEPGVEYAYSVAAVNMVGEGCNGPFVDPDCDWTTEEGCSACEFVEAVAAMPPHFNVSGQFPNEVKFTAPIIIKNATLESGLNSDVSSANYIHVLPETHIKKDST